MFQGLLKVERSHSTICIFRRFHRLFRDVLRPSRFYRFQVWCLGNGWCFQMCWLENFCRWSYSSFSEDFALLILNQSWDIFALTPTRGLDEGNQILEFWRLRIDGFFTDGGGVGGWLGWLNFSDPKKALPKPWRLNQGADVLCFVELDCYHECGIRQVIFRRHSKWIFGYAFQEPRFKEILGADGYDVGIPRAFPGSGKRQVWTTGRRQTTCIFGSKTRPCSKHVLESRMAVASSGDARWEKVGWNFSTLRKRKNSNFQLCHWRNSIHLYHHFYSFSSMLLIQQAWILSQIHLTCYRKYLWETFVFTGPGVQSCLEAEWSFFDEAGRRSHESDFWGWTMSCLDLCTLLEILLDTLW